MLTNHADIFRCPLSRKAKKGMACKDVTGFDKLTGLADIENAPIVKIAPTVRGQKYFLRPNDILMIHVGSMERIGKVGLVGDIAEPAIFGRSLMLIRAKTIDPVWLFYWLKQMRDKIPIVPHSPEARSLSSVFLNLDGLKKIQLPAVREVERIHAIHSDILKKAEAIRTTAIDIERNHAAINAIFK